MSITIPIAQVSALKTNIHKIVKITYHAILKTKFTRSDTNINRSPFRIIYLIVNTVENQKSFKGPVIVNSSPIIGKNLTERYSYNKNKRYVS